jgi:hypothetical protein
MSYDQNLDAPEDILTKAFDEFGCKNLAELYHYTYKFTDCGPSIGALVKDCEGEAEWHYCEDLRQFPDFAEMVKQGSAVLCLSVSSIVEGVDQECQTIIVNADPFGAVTAEELSKNFWKAVEEVDQEAQEIWNATHGCSYCFDYPEGDLRPIDPECKLCGGCGTIL